MANAKVVEKLGDMKKDLMSLGLSGEEIELIENYRNCILPLRENLSDSARYYSAVPQGILEKWHANNMVNGDSEFHKTSCKL